jgi:hypothetical protein
LAIFCTNHAKRSLSEQSLDYQLALGRRSSE